MLPVGSGGGVSSLATVVVMGDVEEYVTSGVTVSVIEEGTGTQLININPIRKIFRNLMVSASNFPKEMV